MKRYKTGHSIPVVHALREGVDWVRFPVTRQVLCYNLIIRSFLSAAGDRTHIGTYVGVSPSPASNENNLKK